MTFGERLNHARVAQGWTQEELAGMLYTTKLTISRIERGLAWPRFQLLMDIFILFDCKPNDMLCDERGFLVDFAQVSGTTVR